MLLPCWASGWARRPSRARRRRGAGRRRSHGRRRRRPRRRRGNRRRISGASRRRCTPSALCPGAGRLGRPVAVGGRPDPARPRENEGNWRRRRQNRKMGDRKWDNAAPQAPERKK
eukprot:gene2371-biopygen21527